MVDKRSAEAVCGQVYNAVFDVGLGYVVKRFVYVERINGVVGIFFVVFVKHAVEIAKQMSCKLSYLCDGVVAFFGKCLILPFGDKRRALINGVVNFLEDYFCIGIEFAQFCHDVNYILICGRKIEFRVYRVGIFTVETVAEADCFAVARPNGRTHVVKRTAVVQIIEQRFVVRIVLFEGESCLLVFFSVEAGLIPAFGAAGSDIRKSVRHFEHQRAEAVLQNVVAQNGNVDNVRLNDMRADERCFFRFSGYDFEQTFARLVRHIAGRKVSRHGVVVVVVTVGSAHQSIVTVIVAFADGRRTYQRLSD